MWLLFEIWAALSTPGNDLDSHDLTSWGGLRGSKLLPQPILSDAFSSFYFISFFSPSSVGAEWPHWSQRSAFGPKKHIPFHSHDLTRPHSSLSWCYSVTVPEQDQSRWHTESHVYQTRHSYCFERHLNFERERHFPRKVESVNIRRNSTASLKKVLHIEGKNEGVFPAFLLISPFCFLMFEIPIGHMSCRNVLGLHPCSFPITLRR